MLDQIHHLQFGETNIHQCRAVNDGVGLARQIDLRIVRRIVLAEWKPSRMTCLELLGFSLNGIVVASLPPHIHHIDPAFELIHYGPSHLFLSAQHIHSLLLSSSSLTSSPLASTAADGTVGKEFVDLVGCESSRCESLAFPLIVLIAGQSELGGVVGIVDAVACDDGESLYRN